MRLYTVAVASLAIDAPPKWTDNLLVQHNVPGIDSSGQGRQRRITHSALLQIALIRRLNQELGMSVAQAVQTSTDLLTGRVIFGGGLELQLDMGELRRIVDGRLVDALESAPRPRRGRPPST